MIYKGSSTWVSSNYQPIAVFRFMFAPESNRMTVIQQGVLVPFERQLQARQKLTRPQSSLMRNMLDDWGRVRNRNLMHCDWFYSHHLSISWKNNSSKLDRNKMWLDRKVLAVQSTAYISFRTSAIKLQKNRPWETCTRSICLHQKHQPTQRL